MNQYVVFYQYYGEMNINHYSFDAEVKESSDLTMNEIYSTVRDYIGHVNRFTILSITKLN